MNRFSNAKDAISYIESVGYPKKGLENFKSYLAAIGNPQDSLKCIHVAGTNGKGSTTNYIRSILQAHGLSVATFTSPYLVVHNDRIRIDDENIPDKDILRIINENIDRWDAYELSMFEMDMCISLQYFNEQGVDVAIYEVGIGGRFDATSLISASVGAITNIGMDHKEMLGDTYQKIAYQKAGIIKQGMSVFTTEKKQECIAEFNNEATLVGAKVEQIQGIEILRNRPNVIFNYNGYNNIELSTFAIYQAENAALAIACANEYLTQVGIQVEEHLLRTAIHQAFWKGRMEVIHQNPIIVIDGAHNLEGIQALVESVGHNEDIHILYGVLKQKDYIGMYEELSKISKDITVCFFDNERAIHKEDLPSAYQSKISYDYKKEIDSSIEKNQKLMVCGSLYFISEVRDYIINKNE